MIMNKSQDWVEGKNHPVQYRIERGSVNNYNGACECTCPGQPLAIVGYFATGSNQATERMFAQDLYNPPKQQLSNTSIVSDRYNTFEYGKVSLVPQATSGRCEYLIVYYTY